jgi:hypothetical protein
MVAARGGVAEREHLARNGGDAMKVGLARRIITPQQPMFMAGYFSRDHPFESVLHDLWAKSLAVEDEAGARIVIVTVDLAFLSQEICEAVAERVLSAHGIARENIVFNASHTHSGPLVAHPKLALLELPAEHERLVHEYTAQLVGVLTEIITEALENLAPAQLEFGHGKATFAVNRRQPTPDGIVNGCNPDGPSDHNVPVLKITAPDGSLRAVLFGYACHTTSMTSRHYLVNGDYAGYAQIALEEKYPGAQAMFLQLCGADQNPLPRGTIELTRDYGVQLATAVQRAMSRVLPTQEGTVRGALQTIELDFAPHSRATFEARLLEESKWRVRHARLMLKTYDKGCPIRQMRYPVQAIGLGDLVLLALSGEVVVDYALRARRELGDENLIVAGYCNDFAAYIPSQRVLEEGGYEGGYAMIYFMQPMPFTADVEERIFDAAKNVVSCIQNDAA